MGERQSLDTFTELGYIHGVLTKFAPQPADTGEQLRELDGMKDAFLSAVSHELRTPVTICRLPPGEEEFVFEPFRTASPRTGRTGLGLSIVRGIARAHDGESGVVNRPGHGATFWIRIPR